MRGCVCVWPHREAAQRADALDVVERGEQDLVDPDRVRNLLLLGQTSVQFAELALSRCCFACLAAEINLAAAFLAHVRQAAMSRSLRKAARASEFLPKAAIF